MPTPRSARAGERRRSVATGPPSPARCASVTSATVRVLKHRLLRRRTRCTSIPRASRSTRSRRQFSAWCAPASRTERSFVERSSGDEIRGHQRRQRRAYARGRPPLGRAEAQAAGRDLGFGDVRHQTRRRGVRRFHRPHARPGRGGDSPPGARPYLERKGVSLKDLLVMKFGGTSVGSAERMRVAARLSAEQKRKRPVVIVVSAMSGVTDLLIETTKHAEAGDRAGRDQNIRKLEERHVQACRELLPTARQKPVLAGIHQLVGEFQRITHGMLMLQDRPPRSVDEAIAIGERLSALLIAACLNAEGTKAEAVNAAELIVTDAVFGSASPLMAQTAEKACKRLMPRMRQGVLPVVTGFNGATADGRPTTLGRGGSDFSASILSAALGARELWIWTDVDGIMTADPRLVPDAAVLDQVTYREAAELAYNGAKVLHPRTLAPLVESHIPVWSKNSFSPEKPGTKIVPRLPVTNGARAVTSMAHVALVSLEPAHATLPGAHVMARALAAMAGANVEVLSLSSSSYRQSFCFLVRSEELEKPLEAMESALAHELAHGYLRPIDVNNEVGLLAVVGEGMQGTPGLAGRIFTAISRERINIIAIAQGSSELTIAIVVRRDGLESAVRAVHAECAMGRPKVVKRQKSKGKG